MAKDGLLPQVTFEIGVYNKGDKGAKGDVGPKGDRGERGEPGTTDYNQLTNKPDLTLKADKFYVDSQDTALRKKIETDLDGKANKAGDTFTSEVIVNSNNPVLGYRQIRAGKDISWGLNSAGEFIIWDNKNNANVCRIGPNLKYVKIGDIQHLYNTGPPNGRIAASPGSTYTDTAVTCGAVKWVKMWGTGNTGWAVLYGDTGWRNIKSLLDSFWDNTSNLQIRRIDKNVYLRTNSLKVGNNPTGARSANKQLFPGKDDMPLGFRGNGWGTCHGLVNIGSVQLGAIYSYRASYDFTIRGVPGVGNWTKGDILSFNLSYVTENDWPTTLPGG